MAPSWRTSQFLNPRLFPSTQRKQLLQGERRSTRRAIRMRMRRLKAKMEETSKEQREIREGQRVIRARFEAIEEECEELKKETEVIMKQSARTQVRLCFMFNILKAREQGDFATAEHLTGLLRLAISSSRRN